MNLCNGYMICTFRMMKTGYCLGILTSSDLLKTETGLVGTLMTSFFSTRLLVTLGFLSYLSRVELSLGLTCRMYLCWNNWTGFLHLTLGSQSIQIQLFFLWPRPPLIMFLALFPLTLTFQRVTVLGLRTI